MNVKYCAKMLYLKCLLLLIAGISLEGSEIWTGGKVTLPAVIKVRSKFGICD
jgi:hypothetical protein